VGWARGRGKLVRLLDVQAEIGRVFGPEDGEPGRSPVAVISHAFWRERFAADPAIVGRSIRLEGDTRMIVGVLPRSFQFTLVGRALVWTPLVFTDAEAVNRRASWVVGLGRLRDDVSVDGAASELGQLSRTLAGTYPGHNGRRGVRVVPLAEEIRRHHDGGFLVPVIFAMSACVLLVACVNVTNVMLARATARRHEMAVRLALGASRSRIVRQSLVEHLLLFVGASAIGAALAVYEAGWATSSVPYENRGYLRHEGVLSIDRAVLLFALAAGAVCGIVFGWLPAWTAAAADVTADLRESTLRATTGKG